jgi:thiamine pyrophosphate-dependent acetolactate synthase large subunit-like protein
MGVPAHRAESAEDLAAALEAGFAEEGPSLVEVLL